jgi:hypothetical protein
MLLSLERFITSLAISSFSTSNPASLKIFLLMKQKAKENKQVGILYEA